jgi:hypothetical protein
MHAWEFQALNSLAEKDGWLKFISMQNYYSFLNRKEERWSCIPIVRMPASASSPGRYSCEVGSHTHTSSPRNSPPCTEDVGQDEGL